MQTSVQNNCCPLQVEPESKRTVPTMPFRPLFLVWLAIAGGAGFSFDCKSTPQLHMFKFGKNGSTYNRINMVLPFASPYYKHSLTSGCSFYFQMFAPSFMPNRKLLIGEKNKVLHCGIHNMTHYIYDVVKLPLYRDSSRVTKNAEAWKSNKHVCTSSTDLLSLGSSNT